MRGTNSRNKPDQKTTSLRLKGVEMGLKSLDPQKAHLGHLLNVRTLFQLPSLIWRGDKGGTEHF